MRPVGLFASAVAAATLFTACRDAQTDTLPFVEGQTPPQIARRAVEAGRLGGYDVVMLDTAGP